MNDADAKKQEIESPDPDGQEDLIDIDSPEALEDPDLDERIHELEAEKEQLRDKWMRALAEAENARKRSEKDRREAEQYGGSRLARDLLPVFDNMRRATEAISKDGNEENKAVLEGVELTMRSLISVFKKHGIEPISPEVGDKFDPQLHEAMFEAPVPGTKAGEIIQVEADGFMLYDRLLRPAKVGVSSTLPS